ncbi:protein kinase [Archangium violaceum]|nr:protein kinase [Archangium violaceum]
MIVQRPCRTCGGAIPEGLSECPRDGTAVELVSYSEDKTVVRAALAASEEEEPSASEQSEWESTVRKDILVGQRLGEYVVRRRIGSGGMGVVYEGEHPVIGRKVAIKIIRPDSSEGIRSRELVSEARATSAIRHRGIIDIFGFGTLPGIGQYLVMEFLNGRPLDEVIMDRAPMPPAEVIQLITEVLGALSAAHAVGVIHRDLKPGNIFVVLESNGSEYVKVLDFGLAKQGAAPHSATPQTRASMIVGTPEYMAPEQACGQPVSPRTDLYAVGIILFEMLTGRLPFRGDSPMHVAIQQVQAQPPAPSSFVDGLPPELEALVLRLLSKEPEQRPASADAVARELKTIARTLAVEMTQLSGFARHVPEFELPTRPRARQEVPGVVPQRGAPSARPAATPAPQTVTAPQTMTDASPVAPARPVASARPQAPRPQTARPAAPARPQAAAPRPPSPTDTDRLRGTVRDAQVPDTSELVPAPRSRLGMKLLLPVGLAAVFLGVGVGVVVHKDDTGPTPVPVQESQVGIGSRQVPGPVPAPATPPEPEMPARTETPPPSAQVVASTPDEAPPSQKTGSGLSQEQKDSTPEGKRRSPPSGPGSFQLVSACWREVYIDGTLRGRAPMKPISLPSGVHDLELINNPNIQDHRVRITIRAGETSEYSAPCKPTG